MVARGTSALSKQSASKAELLEMIAKRQCLDTSGSSDQVDAATLWSALARQRFGRSRPVAATPA